MWATILFFLLQVLPDTLSGQPHFTMTEDLAEAYEFASTLRIEKASAKLDEIRVSDPENLLIYHIENYLDFFEIFINEEKERFEILKKNKDKRLKKIKTGNPNDPYFRFSQAEINLQWALARLKFDEKWTASREIYRAYKLLEENAELHPDFIYNYKSLSVIHVLVKSIPGLVRTLFGIKGSILQGTQEIRSLYLTAKKEKLLFEDEINIIYAYILFYQNNQPDAAWKVLEEEYFGKEIKSPLVSFIVANMAQKTGKNDMAIQLLESRSKEDDQAPFVYLEFLLGKFKLYKLEENAEKHILSFTQNFKGRHFIREAFQKLGWYHLVINDDLAAYKKYMKIVKDKGYDLIDEDKQALKEAKTDRVPHPDLLKARLLYDGSYYERAYHLLIKKAHIFYDINEKHEYNYRMGRITQALKNYPEAINYYVQTLNNGNKKSHMSCNAALQIALILEDQKKDHQALDYLEKCLDINPDRYKNSIHQKAKSAKQRIQEKNKT